MGIGLPVPGDFSLSGFAEASITEGKEQGQPSLDALPHPKPLTPAPIEVAPSPRTLVG